MRTPTTSGSALLIVMGFVLVASVVAVGALSYVVQETGTTSRQIRLEQALHLAEAGVEAAAQHIIDEEAYIFNNRTHGSEGGTAGSFAYAIQKEGFRSFSISSTGTIGGVRRAVTIDEVYVPTFAKFGWWSQVNGNIWFFFGDVLYGDVHTDDALRLSSITGLGPVFHDSLTSLRPDYQMMYNGSVSTETDPNAALANYVDIQGNFRLNTGNGSMADVDWPKYKAIASNPGNNQGMYLEGLTYVSITGNTMYVTNPNEGYTDEPFPIGNETILYVADAPGADSTYDYGYVLMEGGTLDGAMTIYSENDIYLRDHQYYANNPADDDLPPGHQDVHGVRSDDKLGLVSLDDVWVSSAAPSNLDVYAAIMATGMKSPSNDGSFGVSDYSTRAPSGDLTIFGSIVQQVRGAVSTFNSNGLVSGFYKDYYWDPRFETDAPPYFPPLSEQIEVRGWAEAPVSGYGI